MMRWRGFAETPPTGGKPLIVLIEYRSLTALCSLGIGQEASSAEFEIAGSGFPARNLVSVHAAMMPERAPTGK